ncbi:hypothetical protein [Galbibacter sp.]|uniref:hypothetical protein n=1 Tax=Galbibacter sp. TaxID=2918471 RepID=UPI003A8D9D0B
MKGQKRLQYCLNQIELKLDWGKSQSWKEADFLTLSELIYQETEISISPHTLKRLFGKIKYKEHYNPQRATKDALAKFIGFKDWLALTIDYNEKFHSEAEEIPTPKWKRKTVVIGLVILVGIISILPLTQGTHAMSDINENDLKDSIFFNTTDTIGTVPYTVAVNYNIKNLKTDSVWLDFNFNHPITGPEIKNLDKQRSLFNYTYQIPGYYKITLTGLGQQLATENVLATSKDWFSYYYPENNQISWLNNQIRVPREKGYLYYTLESLAKEGLDINSVYYVNHRLFKNFEIDGDNFEMKVRFKNSKDIGGITCYDFFLSLFCENDFTEIKLMEKGCSSYSGIKVGELVLNGVDEDLSSLTFDSEQWNILRMIIKDQKVQVFINEELVFSDAYKGTNGNIVGIEQLFKGTGILDYIHLKDLKTEKEFFDDFDRVVN